MTVSMEMVRVAKSRPSKNQSERSGYLKIIEGFTVADVILVVGQTRQNLQWMYGKNRDFDAR